MVKLLSSAIVLAVSSVAAGVVTDINWAHQDSGMAGYVTVDYMFSFTDQLTGVQLLSEGFSAGSFYQSQYGSNTAPSGALIGFEPTLAYDTFMTMGGLTAETSEDVLIAGGAVNLGGGPGATFSSDKLDVAWAPAAGVIVEDQADYLVARLTMPDTANGTLHWLVGTSSGNVVISSAITNGSPILTPPDWPEPGTAVLVGLGGLMLMRRR